MTIVYRVQDKNGCGPYHTDKTVSSLLSEAHAADRHRPGPRDDIPNWFSIRLNYGDDSPVFGFLLRQDALDWFDGLWEELERDGFSLVEIEVDDRMIVGFGTVQVVFIRGEEEEECL